jgi:hypothetical protein
MAAWAPGPEITLRVTGVMSSVMAGLLPGSRGRAAAAFRYSEPARIDNVQGQSGLD